MATKMRRNVMGYLDDRALIYAALFLICALLSALGAGILALASLLPAAAVVELLSRWGRRQHPRGMVGSPQ